MKPIDKRLDDVWSELVKLKAGNRCEKCFKTSYLNSHHIFSRSNKSVRWVPINGICLCAGCHALNNDSAHKSPLFFAEWFRSYRGEQNYQILLLKAHSIGKLHTFEKEILLKELQKEIKSLQND